MSVRWVFNDIPKLPGRVRDGARRGVERGAGVALEAVNANTPVRSGRLRAGNRVAVAGQTATVQNDVPYSIFVELGTSKMAPRLFMTKGINTSEPRVFDAIAQEAGRALAGGR